MTRDIPLSLTYLDRFSIEDKSKGLCEPSGVTLSHQKDALWTISDDTKKVFKLDLNGKLIKGESFKIPEKGLEGLVLDPTGRFLLGIKEETNEIMKIKIDAEKVADRNPLDKMVGYDSIASFFAGGEDNKGLEGIAWNDTTGTIFVLKEGVPGLLVEVSADLQTIRSHQLLNQDNGFHDNDLNSDEIDFSGICYDSSRHCFWIVSDKAKRLFLYDCAAEKVTQSFRLGYAHKGKYREIEKAEGVEIDPDSNRLYIVSDKEAMLYVFDIRE